ncbi:serine/threonine-protein kinase Nek4-like isoform X2 [Mercenaria mercenaria]|uniref:serine/threonine-protein kinase Nek4-like isoform X2 n=1 Tax=Mercenaria mercenaria TaxID=6596 RepID=UPI00234F4C7F|nr:serine/threonine-protein kinase Nek4-like isoform X2 [Mercenaria mercenaria]
MATAIDQFEYIRNIGKGSYGEVTLARHKRDRKQYVLKKINLKKASSRERRSAEQETKLLSKLKHPNIVRYKDSFEKEGFLYIAMQYCEGGDLYTYCNKLKEQKGTLLEERQLVEWFVQIAMALEYMHERDILHRDLKTQNIFLTKSIIIKVGDLGIARVLDNCSDMATTLFGTPYYMSPELFSNKPYNHKSDVWALGCCVYEMMTLKHAFNAKDMNSLVFKILRGKMPPMPRQYSQDLVSLLRSMLHQDPGKRPTVSRILRDPYIKKNIAILLEETKQRHRPASASRPQVSRPGSAHSVSSVSSSSSSVPVSARSRSSASSQQGIDVPDRSRSSLDSERSQPERSVVSVSSVEVGAGEPSVEKQTVQNHRRKPVDFHPIHEGKMVVDLKEEEDGSDQDTIKQGIIKQNSSKDSKENQEIKQKEEPPHPKSDRQLPVPSSSPPRDPNRRKKKSILSKHVSSSSESANSRYRNNIAKSPSSGSKKSSAFIFENPKPVDNPRPLPPPPKVEGEGLPQRRNNYQDVSGDIRSTESKSSSSSGSKDDNISLGDETPGSLPNMSAQEKRRRNNNAQSYDRPHSSRIKLEQPESAKSTVITEREKKRQKPVDNPRPLPPPPKVKGKGLPQRRNNYQDVSGDIRSTESKSSSSSGSKDDNISLGDETPGSLPNMSAQEKRRRNNNAQSYDRPHSSRIKLERPESAKSTVITEREKKRYEQQAPPARHRQPSIVDDDSSSSDEDTLKAVDSQRQRNKQQHRGLHLLRNGDSAPKHRKHINRKNKEVNNLISVLDNTLHIDKDDDEEELQEVKVTDETPRIPKSSSMPSVDTLCNADRLMARIKVLHEDCIKGVGWPILKQAYEILGRIEEDEVEPKLVALMGKDNFDLYAGKIWQLKFCEDMARIGIPF